MENFMKKNVIIIGAGPAGLTAAYELLKDNSEEYNVIILEETNEIGGISKTVNYKNNRIDIGGHRFFSKNKEIMDFWKTLMPVQGSPSLDDKLLKREKNLTAEGPNPEIEDNVLLVRQRVSRIYYLKKFFDYPISLKIQTFKNMGFKRTVKSGFSYLKTIFYKRKEESLEDFYINRFGKYLYEMFFEKYTEKLWGRHPSQISADWGAQRVKGVSITAVIKNALFKSSKNKETSLIEEFWYPKYGVGQLWETLALKVEQLGGCIKKNCKVVGIQISDDKVEQIKYIENGEEKNLKGDIFLSSMPLKELILGMGKFIPAEISEIAEGLPYRDFITVGLLLNKINLKNETNIKTLGNIIPDCWIYMQEPEVKMCRIQIFNNWSPYMLENPMNNIWIGMEYVCSEKDDLWKMQEDEMKNYAINELKKLNLINEDEILDYHVEKIKKAYPAYFDTYSEIDKVIEYVNKFDNLYCIGRNGQHRYNNMDHSMLTAIEAVKCIKGENENKDIIWKVNTEKEYHESVKKIPKNG